MPFLERIKLFINQCKRVVLVSTKPDPEEFKISSKVTALGIAIIGAIGFIVFMIFAATGAI